MGSSELFAHCRLIEQDLKVFVLLRKQRHEINTAQQTDTHGWLEGHLKEGNYGADWGVSREIHTLSSCCILITHRSRILCPFRLT